MSMTFILIEIKFDIDINNNELLKTIWKHKGKKKKKKIITGSMQQHGAQIVKLCTIETLSKQMLITCLGL